MRHIIYLMLLIVLPLQAQMLVPKGGERIYGNVRNGNPAGMYSLPTVEDGERIPLITGSDFSFNSAGTFNGEHYVVTSYTEMFGYWFVYHYLYDPDTWQSRGYSEGEVGTIATDMDYNPKDGKIYGCFFNDQGNGYVFGYLKTSGYTWERVSVCTLQSAWVGVACHPDGTIYAITNTGVLNKVDPATGNMTAVGSTGLSPRYISSATISRETNLLYYNLVDANQASIIYSIDLETAKATKCYQLDKAQAVYGMFVPKAKASDGAPAQVEDFAVTFERGSLSGTAIFTVPAECYDGSALTGDVTYEITSNSVLFKSGTVQPGDKASIALDIKTAGQYTFALRLKNGAGASPEVSQTMWVGKDIPNAPTNIVLTYDKETETAHLTWTAPTTSTHGGYVDFDAITYDIMRCPGYIGVAEGLTATEFSEKLPMPENLTHYYYIVQARYDELASPLVNSNELSLGYVSLPYTETFDELVSTKGWAFYNLNDDNDFYGWGYCTDPAMGSNCLQCMMSRNGENNDWAITPGFRLEAGLLYEFSVDVRGYKQYPNVYRLCLGANQTPADMTIELLPRTEHRGDEWETMTVTYTPEKSGVYYFGINDCSAYNMYTLYLDNVRVGSGISVAAPGAPTDLTVIPDPYGGRRVDISFVTPDKDAKGETLTSLTKVEMYRNDALLKTWESPAVGSKIEYTDLSVVGGYYTYRVVAYNAAGAGQEVSHRCFVGANKPSEPTDVMVSETETAGTVLVQWTAPEYDIDGQDIAPELITYNISMVKDGTEHVIATGVEGTQYIYKVCEPDDEQSFVYFNIKGKTAGGTGEAASSMMCPVGKAYTMTFSDGFADGNQRYRYATSGNGYGVWASIAANTTSITDCDGDNGMLRFAGSNGGFGDFLLPKIHVEGKSPVLIFWTRNYSGTNGNVVQIIAVDGTNVKALATIAADETKWTEQTVSLAELVGRDARLIMRAVYDNASYTFVDNLHIKDDVDHNLTAYAIDAPVSARPDEPFTVSYTVENNGKRQATGYTVHLLRDGISIATANGAVVAAGKKASGTFTTVLNASANPVTNYGIRIEYAADQFTSDNITGVSDMARVALASNALPTVTTLSGELTSDGYSLTWEAPETTTTNVTSVTDSFEEYAANATSHIGEWTLVDADHNFSGGIENFKIGIENKQISFFVFDLSQNSKYPDPHSGTKMMATIFTESGANDDWLITPRLSGAQQYISLYARSYKSPYLETFELLYTTDEDPADITKYQLLQRVVRAADSWTEYGALVPEGATYFAIRCVSENQFFFLVDDVTFIPANGESTTLTLLGYNVYRDYERINDQLITDCHFVDAGRNENEDCIHTYTVTAVYAEGESARSNECLLIPTGIGLIDGTVEMNIYDMAGRKFNRPVKGVNIVNGKKVAG